jgi:Phosphodiester glycosidase
MSTPAETAEHRPDELAHGATGSTARVARREATARRRRRRRRWRISLVVLLVVLSPALYSYTTTMLQLSSLPFGVRSVEWLRANHGNWLVDEVEHYYYGWFDAPKKGGPQLKTLPVVGIASTNPHGGSRHQAAIWPPPVKPIFPHPLPGEGVWKPTGPLIDGRAPILVTTFRTERDYPRIIAYVAWFDHTRTAIAYYPGRYEPPSAAVRGPMMVPYNQRWRLLATFNGGFTYSDGSNGSADNGAMNEPLKEGNATLLGYTDGRIAIVDWHGGQNAGRNVAWARQSLAPIVWNGRINPELNTNPNSPQWGYTLGGVTRTWRTGVGIDRRGNLMYVAADDQTVITLARILQHLGAVRAMEFDINPEWHTLITYDHRNRGFDPTLVEPQPMQSPYRYLVPDDRDFFAVFRRIPGPVTVPFR